MEKDYIKHGDCLELMKEIPNKSIDLILCDLPYGVLNKNNKNAKWDTIIPFESLWNQYKRIIKEHGVIALFGQGMFTAELMLSNKKWWRYNLIWDKVLPTGFLNANRMPLRSHEDICIFYNKLPQYNPQMTKVSPYKRNHSKGNMLQSSKNNCYGDFIEVPTIIRDEKFPKSIISIKKEHINGKFYHPTQKPVELLEYLIKTYTKENDIVLDSCMGSGSTLVAAIKQNRHYIGFELDEKYYQVAKDRIEKTKDIKNGE